MDNNYIITKDDGYIASPTGIVATSMDLYYKFISNIDGIENFPSINYLKIQYNKITKVDLSQNTKLTDYSLVGYNALDYVKPAPGVQSINFKSALFDYTSGWSSTSRKWSSTITMIGSGIKTVDVSDNKLQTLDLSGCTSLTSLSCKQQSGINLTKVILSVSVQGNVSIDKDAWTVVEYK